MPTRPHTPHQLRLLKTTFVRSFFIPPSFHGTDWQALAEVKAALRVAEGGRRGEEGRAASARLFREEDGGSQCSLRMDCIDD